MKINMNKESQTKFGSKWITLKETTEEVDLGFYDTFINAKRFFKIIGTERHYKQETCCGVLVTKVITTSPDKKTRYIYKFSFSKD